MTSHPLNREASETPDQPFVPGTLVICKYRLLWVGTVEEPGDDPAQWNGRNSERHYCEVTGTVRVRYPFGVQHDSRESLVAVSAEQAALMWRSSL